MFFTVNFQAQAHKNLKKIPRQWQTRIINIIQQLKSNPFLGKKLHGDFEGMYSVRAWPYRIIYQIQQKELRIIIINIAHRQSVYNN